MSGLQLFVCVVLSVHKTYLKTLLNPYQELYMEFSGNMNFAGC